MLKTGVYGFRWTYLFFRWFVTLFRSQLGVVALHLIFTMVTFGFLQFIVCLLYNKQYMTRMLNNGWVLAGTNE